mgnify:CR=1 FL=1
MFTSKMLRMNTQINPTSEKVAVGLEAFVVTAYRIYWLTSEHDVLNCSAIFVNRDNRPHTRVNPTIVLVLTGVFGMALEH